MSFLRRRCKLLSFKIYVCRFSVWFCICLPNLIYMGLPQRSYGIPVVQDGGYSVASLLPALVLVTALVWECQNVFAHQISVIYISICSWVIIIIILQNLYNAHIWASLSQRCHASGFWKWTSAILHRVQKKVIYLFLPYISHSFWANFTKLSVNIRK